MGIRTQVLRILTCPFGNNFLGSIGKRGFFSYPKNKKGHNRTVPKTMHILGAHNTELAPLLHSSA